MMKFITEESSADYDLIPENDQANAILAGVDENVFEWEGKKVEKLRWRFMVTDEGPWRGKEITGDTSMVFTAHPNCRAYNWAVTIAGRDFVPGVEFDTDDIIGLPCRILIGHKAQKNTGRVFMKVTDVMAPRTAVPAHDPAVAGAKF